MSFRSAMGANTSARTANGAVSYNSTGNYVLDMFSDQGAWRGKTWSFIQPFVVKAFQEDSLLALKSVFHLRNVRGGQGERENFRLILKWLASEYTSLLALNIQNIPLFGRWDDVLALLNTPLELEVLNYMKMQLANDITAERPSLLAKWLPSINTSSKTTVTTAKKIADAWNLTPKQYRVILSRLRTKINVIEKLTCSNNWNGIVYPQVSSNAMMKYRKAFYKHDASRFQEYIDSLVKGETKINSGTLFPYDIVNKVRNGDNSPVLEEQWKALPNYLGDAKAIAVVDVSGSMDKKVPKANMTAMDIAISIGVYSAEKNTNPAFAGTFITFSTDPQFVELQGKTLREKCYNMSRAKWSMSTDLQKVFAMILEKGLKFKVPQEEMPKTILVVSDMQFNSASPNITNLDAIRKQYENSGYTMPKLVFWNVMAYGDKPTTVAEQNTVLVSGFSSSAFSVVMSQKDNALDYMLEVLNSEMYSCVVGE